MATGSRSRRPEAAAENRHPRGEEGEHRHGDAGRDRPDPVLEAVRHVGPAVQGADRGHGGAGLHGDDEAEEHARHRRVDPGAVDERPRREGQWQEQPPVGDAVLDQRREDAQRDHGRQQREQLEVGGEEDGDDGDRDEVVDDRQGEQERPQRRGQGGPDDGQHGEREGDVGRGGDRPAAGGVAVGPQHHHGDEEDQSREDDPADGREHGDGGLGARAQVPDEELALELEPGDEEEDRQQAVGRPVPHGEPQVAPLRPEVGVAQRRVGVAPRAVGEEHGRDRREEQEGPAGRLGAQGARDELRLGPRRAAEQGGRRDDGRGCRAHASPLRSATTARGRRALRPAADQASRRSAVSLTVPRTHPHAVPRWPLTPRTSRRTSPARSGS